MGSDLSAKKAQKSQKNDLEKNSSSSQAWLILTFPGVGGRRGKTLGRLFFGVFWQFWDGVRRGIWAGQAGLRPRALQIALHKCGMHIDNPPV